MRIRYWITAGTLALFGALVVVAVLSRIWAACGVGVNAAANSLLLIFGYAPAVALAIFSVTVGIFWLTCRSVMGSMSRVGVLAACMVTMGIVWFALHVGHTPDETYPAPTCVGGIPEWWVKNIPV